MCGCASNQLPSCYVVPVRSIFYSLRQTSALQPKVTVVPDSVIHVAAPIVILFNAFGFLFRYSAGLSKTFLEACAICALHTMDYLDPNVIDQCSSAVFCILPMFVCVANVAIAAIMRKGHCLKGDLDGALQVFHMSLGRAEQSGRAVVALPYLRCYS